MSPKDYSDYGLAQELLRLRTHRPDLMVEAATRLSALASRQEAPAASAQPMFFASPEQANALQDRPGDSEGGVYLPLRKTVAGKFTMPLYATPTAARSPATVAQPVEWPDDVELEAWRSTADDLLRSLPELRGTEIRSAAHLLQNAYLFASKAKADQPCPSQGCGGDGGEALTDERIADAVPVTATILPGNPRKVCMTLVELHQFIAALSTNKGDEGSGE